MTNTTPAPIKPQWKQAHMRAAFNYAACSDAVRLKVGAVIVKDNAVISIGINGTPPGFHTNCCELEGPDGSLVTRPEVIHAERNALNKLRRRHTRVSPAGAALFVTNSPCLPCAEAIHKARITHVFFSIPYRDPAGLDFLRAKGIEVEQIAHPDTQADAIAPTLTAVAAAQKSRTPAAQTETA